MFWDQEASVISTWHPSHVISNIESLSYPICMHCGVTAYQTTYINAECPAEPTQHRTARLLDASQVFKNSTLGTT